MPQATQYNMLSSLVGADPDAIRQQQYQNMQQTAAGLAGMDPLQASAYMMGMGGAGFAAPVAGMLGLQNPTLSDAQQSQAIQQIGDNTTPEGLLATAAKFNAVGNTRMAMMYTQAAQALKAQNAETNLRTAQTAKALSDANAPANPFNGINTSLYTPASLGKYRDTQNMSDLVLRPDLVDKNTRSGTDNPYGKINPKDYTPESLRTFDQTGNFSDLVPREKPTGTGGARNLQMTKRMISAADLAAADVDNLTKLPAESSTGWLGGRKDATSLMLAPFNALVNTATPQSVQDYNATAAGLQRNLAAIESAGLMPSGSLTNQMEAVMLKQGDTNLTKMRKMAQIRQIVEAGLSHHMDDPTIPQELRDHMAKTIERIQKSVPFTVDDVNNLRIQGQKNPSATLGSLYQSNAPVSVNTQSTPSDLQSAAAAELARRRGGK